ncbi:hypothetical protein FQN54_001510 [Arachnomyces sp. PD_36]|nr:hypothetical protein FQN54_001510 [Arachnomyces sp. PD_36]
MVNRALRLPPKSRTDTTSMVCNYVKHVPIPTSATSLTSDQVRGSTTWDTYPTNNTILGALGNALHCWGRAGNLDMVWAPKGRGLRSNRAQRQPTDAFATRWSGIIVNKDDLFVIDASFGLRALVIGSS